MLFQIVSWLRTITKVVLNDSNTDVEMNEASAERR